MVKKIKTKSAAKKKMAKPTRKAGPKMPGKRGCKPCVVKRAGHEELYDERKVYATCYYAAKATHLKTKKVEEICGKVVKEVNNWITKCKCVTAHQIHKQIVKSLRKYQRDVAFMYDTHRDIS